MDPSEAHSLGAAAASEMTLEELRIRNAELAAAVAARDAFIAVAAHELSNPMTPMIGQVDLLLSGIRTGKYSPKQVEQRLERVRQVMNHYVRRAGVLLNVSRMTSGKFRLEPAPCDLADVVRKTVETFAEAARHAGSPIGLEASASLLGTWDRLAIEQIVDNLVSNAVKYGASRPVEVCVDDLGDKVRIIVRDHGTGISAENRLRIFGQFERAVGLNENHSGFGVGLWVVGQLVEGMAGTVTIEDAPGGGSVFAVTLPRNTEATCP